jgi:flagellar hook-length control protein FliK
LASVANAQGNSANAADSTSATPNTDTSKQSAAAKTANDPVNLTNAVVSNAAAGQVAAFNAKVPLSEAQGNVVGTAATKANTAIAAQTAVAVNPAATVSKNSAGQSSTFEAALNKASVPINSDAEKITAASTQITTETSTTSTSSNQNVASTDSLLSADSSMQTLKSANQDLSAAQMSAIAPVFSVPTSEVAATTNETIAPPVGTSAWDEAVGQKINWMVNENQQSASLTLNPPELGPLQVVLSVSNQHASATFTSHQPEVRAALENAIPKLREMLNQSGIQLGDCNVNSQAKQQFAQNQSSSGSSTNASTEAVTAANTISAIPNSAARSGLGLVDTFV